MSIADLRYHVDVSREEKWNSTLIHEKKLERDQFKRYFGLGNAFTEIGKRGSKNIDINHKTNTTEMKKKNWNSSILKAKLVKAVLVSILSTCHTIARQRVKN